MKKKTDNMEILENHIRKSPGIVGIKDADRYGELGAMVLREELKGGTAFDARPHEHPRDRVRWAMQWASDNGSVKARCAFGLVALVAMRHELSEHRDRLSDKSAADLERDIAQATADLEANKAHVDAISAETGLTLEMATTQTFWV